MEDMVSKFSGQFAFMEDEQHILMVDAKEVLTLRSSKVFLVGKVLTQKPFNKESFKRQMQSLWKPKANDFWFLIKALPICYMMRQMGKLLGNHLGEYILLDQS
ncbi:hypothetical protein ACFX2H_009024 [Malus domestica]